MKPVPSDSNAAFIDECKRAWRARLDERRAALETRKRTIIKAARACATYLKNEHGASDVIMFGSMARDGAIHETSDLDLVVRGAPDAAYFTIMRNLHDIARRITGEHGNIDLIFYESVPGRLKATIDNSGVHV